MRSWSSVGVLALVLAGCNTTPGDRVVTEAAPATPVVRTVTNFEQAKRCMDQLFLDFGKRGINITTGDITDATGSVKVSEKDMIIKAISDMSVRSGAFAFFSVEAINSSVDIIQRQFAPLERVQLGQVPDVYVRGSISQSDNNVTSDGQSGSVTLPFVSIGMGQNQVTGTIGVDFQMASTRTRQIVPNVATSNTITIISNDDSTSARGLISQGGFGGAMSVSLSSAQREGRGQAVRTLIELSMIELLGKYTRVPYQRCLSMESGNPAVMKAARDLYDKMTPDMRTRAVQNALARNGEYKGPVDGRMSAALQDAVSLAKDRRGLLPDGRVDNQIFTALYEENLLETADLPERPAADPAVSPPVSQPVAAGGRDPIGLKLDLARNDLKLGDAIQINASAEVAVRLFCYYEFVEKGAPQIVRIFPNRFQTDNMLPPHQTVTIPRTQDPFQIKLNSQNDESIACVATTADYSHAAASQRVAVLRQPDLTPLECGFPGIGCPVYEHQGLAPLETASRMVTFRVRK